MKLVLLVDDLRRKLIYAQAEKDFVDFVASLFAFPLGQLLDQASQFVGDENQVIGNRNLKNLYTSFRDTDGALFSGGRDTFVHPCALSTFFPPLLTINPSRVFKPERVYYRCTNCPVDTSWISRVEGGACRVPGCAGHMNNPIRYHESFDHPTNAHGFVMEGLPYLVTNDLLIKQPTYIDTFELMKESMVAPTAENTPPENLRPGKIRRLEVTFDEAKAQELLNYLLSNEKEVLTRMFADQINFPPVVQAPNAPPG